MIMNILLFVFLGLFSLSNNEPIAERSLSFLENTRERWEVYKDTIRSTPALIRKHGYPAEVHETQTEDGYLLQMQRIPHKPGHKGKNGIPILILPGLACDPNAYVATNDSIAYYLVNHGYDVWLGNHRGNVLYSHHVKHSLLSEAFWNFSWEEMGNYDIPSKIDHIKFHTGYDKIILISYSMSSAGAIALLAGKPEYNSKILRHIALGAVAIGHYQTSVLITLLAPFYPVMKFAYGVTINKGWANFFAFFALKYIGPAFCITIGQKICLTMFNYFLGYMPASYGKRISMTISDVTGGTSFKCMLHLMQQVRYQGMRRYDYGRDENIRRYGKPHPPKYDFTQISSPTTFVVGANDAGGTAINVELVARDIPNVITVVMDNPMFNHADFVWSVEPEQKQKVNEMILENVRKI